MAQVGTVLDLVGARRDGEVVELVRSITREDGLAAAVALLAEVQREVGRRWQHRQFSVADEHAATAVVDLALSAVALEAGPRRTAAVGGVVVVACAEEEWHVMPARMFAEQLRAAGREVVFLGASTPAAHLQRFLAADPPVALALSCTVPLYLPGARRAVSASHAAGVPVLAGGAAFGTSALRAVAIGADSWAPTPGSAAAALAGWARSRPALVVPAVGEADALALGAVRTALVKRAMRALTARVPAVAGYTPWQLAKTREDLDYIIRFVEASLLTADDSIVTDFAGWLASVLAARGLPDGIVALGAGVLRDCLPEGFGEADRLLKVMMAPG
ncbi:MAG: cobalamin B12-binding domain-containing protein [Streptosporangiaceae bacterium]|nr:cobalamin B12-binding domain-containing protein [Streptosporangiaceae bacterium]